MDVLALRAMSERDRLAIFGASILAGRCRLYLLLPVSFVFLAAATATIPGDDYGDDYGDDPGRRKLQ